MRFQLQYLILVTAISVPMNYGWAEVDLNKLPAPAARKDLTFAKDVKPLFDASCIRCHGQERPKAGLRLDSLQAVIQGSSDRKVIIPGKSKESILVHAISQLDEELVMPPKPRTGQGGKGGPVRPNGPPEGSAGPGTAGRPPGGGPGGPGGRSFGPPPKPLTAEQVGLVRAWIDAGAK